jgi:PEP-CTERM motif
VAGLVIVLRESKQGGKWFARSLSSALKRPSSGVDMQGFAKSFAIATLCAATAVAQATTFNLGLTGALANESTYSFDSGGTHYDLWNLDLSGLNAGNAITLNNGDVVNTTITLDGAHTMPASVDGSFFFLQLRGSAFPTTETGVDSTTTFLLGGSPVLTRSSGVGTSGQISAGFYLPPPTNLAYTFDKVVVSFTINTLAVPATIDSADMLTQLNSPTAVPEPETYALMLAGMAAMGFLVRRRQMQS